MSSSPAVLMIRARGGEVIHQGRCVVVWIFHAKRVGDHDEIPCGTIGYVRPIVPTTLGVMTVG
jgi:hypothetical protein